MENINPVLEHNLDSEDQKIKEREGEIARSTIKKLIIIKGEPNVGKTSVCRCVLHILMSDGAIVDDKDPEYKGDFTVKLSYNGIKVAICSMGDKFSSVDKNIRDNKDCDVVIVTSRNFVTLGKILCSRTSIHTMVRSDYGGLVSFAKNIVADIMQI